MRIKIYQIDAAKDKNCVYSQPLDYARELGGIDPSIYKTVFFGDAEENNLEDIYQLFVHDPPGT